MQETTEVDEHNQKFVLSCCNGNELTEVNEQSNHVSMLVL